jgi:hypothetical protein
LSSVRWTCTVQPMLPDPDAIGSACCVDHDARRPCCRRVCASDMSRESRVSRLSRDSPLQRTSQIRRIAGTPRRSRHTHSQRSPLIKWIARVSLSSRKTRVQRSSRHQRTKPATGEAAATADGLRVAGFGSASGSLDIIPQSSANPPPPLHIRHTLLHHTFCHRLHDLAHRHRPAQNRTQLHR